MKTFGFMLLAAFIIIAGVAVCCCIRVGAQADKQEEDYIKEINRRGKLL